MTPRPIFSFVFLCLVFFGHNAWSQARDTTKKVEILPGARKLELLKINDSTQLQILVGNVKLKQGNTLFYCDSCVINNSSHIFEAFGHVHINDGDTANAYSDYLRYLTDKRIAYMQKNVRLTDGKATLTTNNLEYDTDTKIGIYTNGGTVVNKKSVLTSMEGYYYTDLKDIYFKKNVELKDPAYYLKADSLLYNTESEVARFIAKTFIRDSANRTIVTREGYYDTRNRKAEFGSRPIIEDGARRYTGDKISTNDSTHMSQIIGNAVIIDTAQGTTIIGGVIIANNSTESFLAFNKPLMIVKQEKDSIYITADTLFSARLSDLYGVKDSTIKDSAQKDSMTMVKKADTKQTLKKTDTKQKDSTDRYFEAFYHVRIFSDSVQSVCDSMFYSFKDSVFRLFKDPVVWSKENQVTGDTILLFTKNKKADRIKVFENSLLVSKVQADFFNQVKSARMDGYLTDGSLDSVRARGFAECIYYIQNEDSSFTGINQSTSDIIDIYFGQDSTGKERELQKVVFRSAVKGTLWPMHAKTPEELRLRNFKWFADRRPKTKYDLYE
ncbi:MAG TPA: OstA-like protein [Chitinophagaceae bacterium]|nr:OstA-like protein [Chitinophagaceae bacterium]